jgi:hypothetical protein
MRLNCYFHTKTAPPLSSTLPLPIFSHKRYQPLLYQAPMRIKVFDFHRTREKEQSTGDSEISQRFLCSLSRGTPVRTGGPRKSSVPCRVQKGITISLVRSQGSPASAWLTAWAAKHLDNGIIGWKGRPINRLVSPASSRGSTLPAKRSTEQLRFVKIHVIAQDIIGCPCEFVSQGAMCHRRVALVQLRVIKFPTARMGSTSVFGSCREGPRQVLIAIL